MAEPPSGWDWRHPANRAIRAELIDAVRDAAAPELAGSGQVLEVGCGSGWLLRALADEVAVNRLNGVDVDARRVEAAAESLPGAKFTAADARELPYPDARFSVVVVASLLSSLSAEDAERVVAEARRVLEPTGVLLVYDVRPGRLHSPNLRPVPLSEVAEPEAIARARRLTLAPPVARRLGRGANVAYRPLSWVWPLRTHALYEIRRVPKPVELVDLSGVARRRFLPVALPGVAAGVRQAPRSAVGAARRAPRKLAGLRRAFSRPEFTKRLALPQDGLAAAQVWMLVRNDCVNDNRVLREAATLAEAGYSVTILAVLRGAAPEHERRDGFEIVRVPIMPAHLRFLRHFRALPTTRVLYVRLRRRWRIWWAWRGRAARRRWKRRRRRLARVGPWLRERLAPARRLRDRVPPARAVLPAAGPLLPPVPWPASLRRFEDAPRRLALARQRAWMEKTLGREPARPRRFTAAWPVVWLAAMACKLVRWAWSAVFALLVWVARAVLALLVLPVHPVRTVRRAYGALRPLIYRALKALLLRAHRQFLAYDYTARCADVVAERTQGIDRVLAPAATIVHAHDLNALPTGVALARMLGARLVYDSHELQFGTTRATESGVVRRTAVTAWESRLARHADASITVNDSLSRLMERRLRMPRPVVLRNCPEYYDEAPEASSLLYDDLGLAPETRIALYHGNVAVYRGLEELIAASELLPPDVVVVLMGGGSAWDALSKSVADQALAERVRFHRAVPGAILRDVLASVAVGVVPIRAEVANYFYSLPNKLFELMSAGKPVAAANLPEIRALVERHDLGTIFDPDDPADIARAIVEVLDDPAYEVRAAAARAAARQHNWQQERVKLTSLYEGIAPSHAREPELVVASG